MGIDGNDCGIDKLPDDILINILSHMNIIESGRASVLARRWRYLWRSAHETLRFDCRDTASGNLMRKDKFEAWANAVVEHHQDRYIEGMVINFELKGEKFSPMITPSINSLVYFAMQKDVQMLKVNLSLYNRYEFPSVEMLRSNSYGVSPPLCRLRTLRLAHVRIEDEVIHYFLASCPNLEELCIHSSSLTKNLRVIDPPSLRVLEISRCRRLHSLKISAVDLVSLTYRGPRKNLLLENIPNLCELFIGDGFCISFVTEPTKHWSYSVQLEKLVLDFRLVHFDTLEAAPPDLPQLCSLRRLEVFAVAGRTPLVFAPLIKASPQLCEFRIEMSDLVSSSKSVSSNSVLHSLYPPDNERIQECGAKEVMAMDFVHRNLKVVEIGGYIGCRGREDLVLALIKIGPSIERVVIDTETDYFDLDLHRRLRGHEYAFFRRRTKAARSRAKERATNFASEIPKRIKFIVT